MLRVPSQVRPKVAVSCRENLPEDLIERLFFCKQLDVVRVLPTQSSTFTSTDIPVLFYVCKLPLESIIQLETLKAFGFPGKERKSSLKGIMLLHSAVDRTNNMCVTPDGFLHLVLDKESYEQFGTFVPSCLLNTDCLLQIDLHRLATGKQNTLRSRLEWCLKKTAQPVDMAISCSIPLDQVPLQGCQKLSVEPTTLFLEGQRVPLIHNWFVRWSSYIQNGQATTEEDIHSEMEFLVQWMGAIVAQCPALMDMQSELSCDYICPHLEEMYSKEYFRDDSLWTEENIQHQQWQGFIGCHVTKAFCESIQSEVQQNRVKWAIVSCLSFEDVPIMYKGSKIRAASPAMEHSMGLIMVILPNGKYWLVFQPNTQSASLC
ncbi:uncharacterized protein Gasu_33740 [Galdieria sulphuraria]|uniref:Uncharacterized protein n=1 Tax=Galdieria sulphuraria TaxID=130081 RepID=M2XGI6_GALSU|nr:uncharacterized protein Gasu_33740 [Galdieria sulphuraria]EME29172.1 hypothetical protein Gasu_33740 [Galdieria sulphuraria]|eukprot:XP_005705692.1 hypothetical protein Gasu_33740 [Galdieria sulphuraria]